MTNRAILIAAALATGLFAGPVSADVVGVSRCDEAVNGVFRPGLLTVESDGTRTFHPVGENGLTETITFNQSRAFEWVAAQGFYPEDTTFADYDDFICGLPCEECPAEDAPEPDLPDNDEDPTHGTGG
ncbi:hypothetical protein N8I71_04875 [Roseibacterium sp. SDUM158016]|uniref:hypothetical protein n=1 Tax=Roseicyclus sediminis TaxID=2980997 RepID=UPI0021D18CDB|nr:hypothetical protein [Roseibacterium sp. SDUM158016]MCU4652150.1 hypothetical protein [Roseibacterium sp. SDUM158016]